MNSKDIQPVVPVPQLNLFTRENLQMSVQSTQEIEILPTGNWEQQSEIIFNVTGDPESFIDPSSVKLKIAFKIVNGNGGDLEPMVPVAPIANFGCSLFQRVAVRLGNTTQISGFDSLYPYIAYLENVLKAPDFFKMQMNWPYFLWQDKAEFFDSFDVNENPGFGMRDEQVAGSIVDHLLVPIFSPITDQDRLLPPNVGMQFSLHRASDKFLIMSNVAAAGRNQKVQLGSISMTFQKVRLNTQLHLSLTEVLRKEPAIFPCVHRQTIEFSKNLGTRVIRETLFNDKQLPSYVYLFVVSTDRRVGSYLRSPFFVKRQNMTDIKLTSGSETFPTRPYQVEARKTHRIYMDALNCMGSLNNPNGRSNAIGLKDYEEGYGVFGFNLTKGLFPGYDRVDEFPKLGDLQVHMQFSQALPETTSFIFIMEYVSNIYVASNLDVSTDFMA